jgi:hypothetical protein
MKIFAEGFPESTGNQLGDLRKPKSERNYGGTLVISFSYGICRCSGGGETMATSTSNSSVVALSGLQGDISGSIAASGVIRSRKVSYESGRAIEMLGHAIEYLADEFALECMSCTDCQDLRVHPQVVAIEILKKCNRMVYMSCPEIPTFADRVRALLHRERT